jgi:hypothetical protein
VALHGELLSDFLIMEREREIHALNAPSQAATASLAFGSHIGRLSRSLLG